MKRFLPRINEIRSKSSIEKVRPSKKRKPIKKNARRRLYRKRCPSASNANRIFIFEKTSGKSTLKSRIMELEKAAKDKAVCLWKLERELKRKRESVKVHKERVKNLQTKYLSQKEMLLKREEYETNSNDEDIIKIRELKSSKEGVFKKMQMYKKQVTRYEQLLNLVKTAHVSKINTLVFSGKKLISENEKMKKEIEELKNETKNYKIMSKKAEKDLKSSKLELRNFIEGKGKYQLEEN